MAVLLAHVLIAQIALMAQMAQMAKQQLHLFQRRLVMWMLHRASVMWRTTATSVLAVSLPAATPRTAVLAFPFATIHGITRRCRQLTRCNQSATL